MTLIFVFIMGLAIGSFLNVLIDRLSREESILGRSHCDKCKHTLSSLDLVPVISFVALQGRCRYCKTKLSYQYPAIELFTAFSFVLSWAFLSRGPEVFTTDIISPAAFMKSVFYLALVAVFIVIFFADLKYRIIPDEMQIAFLVVTVLLRMNAGTSITALGFNMVEGALVTLPILLIYLFTRGKGMGFGDVKLAFNIGFLLGLKGGLLSLYFGFIIGAVAGIALIVSKQRKLKSKIAFGPFLLLGVLLVIIFRVPVYAFISRIYGI